MGKKKDKLKKKAQEKLAQAARKVEESGPVIDLHKSSGKRSGIDKAVMRDVHREMTRSSMESIDGWHGTALNPQMPDGHKFVLLERASGNVAESLASPDSDSRELYRRCIETAVVALAWATVLRKEKGRPTAWANT